MRAPGGVNAGKGGGEQVGARERGKRVVLTIGHSNHPPALFLQFLEAHGVELVADVRSRPCSRHVPHFNREALSVLLKGRGVGYLFLGDRLGGMPDDERFYDEEGRVLYDRLAASDGFRQGMEELRAVAAEVRVAVMCGEENPAGCHRNLLVGRVLAGEGWKVMHIRGDGGLEAASQGGAVSSAGQGELFPMEKEEGWRSIRSVSPERRRRRSSGD